MASIYSRILFQDHLK